MKRSLHDQSWASGIMRRLLDPDDDELLDLDDPLVSHLLEGVDRLEMEVEAEGFTRAALEECSRLKNEDRGWIAPSMAQRLNLNSKR